MCGRRNLSRFVVHSGLQRPWSWRPSLNPDGNGVPLRHRLRDCPLTACLRIESGGWIFVVAEYAILIGCLLDCEAVPFARLSGWLVPSIRAYICDFICWSLRTDDESCGWVWVFLAHMLCLEFGAVITCHPPPSSPPAPRPPHPSHAFPIHPFPSIRPPPPPPPPPSLFGASARNILRQF